MDPISRDPWCENTPQGTSRFGKGHYELLPVLDVNPMHISFVRMEWSHNAVIAVTAMRTPMSIVNADLMGIL